MGSSLVMIEYPSFFFWHTTFSVVVLESKLSTQMIFQYLTHQLSSGLSFFGRKAQGTAQVQYFYCFLRFTTLVEILISFKYIVFFSVLSPKTLFNISIISFKFFSSFTINLTCTCCFINWLISVVDVVEKIERKTTVDQIWLNASEVDR